MHTTATGGGAAGPPGVGLGNAGKGDELGCWLVVADGDDFAVLDGVVPHATVSNRRTSRNLFTPHAILRPTAVL